MPYLEIFSPALGPGIRIHYEAHGNTDGPVMLLIHGLGCSLDYWRFVFNDTELKRRYHLLALDLPGFGKSGKPRAFSYSMKDQAMVLEKLFCALSLRPEVLVGFSMGGPIAIHLAKRTGTKGLVLVEPTITENDLIITPRLARTPAPILDALKLITFICPAFFSRLLVDTRDRAVLQIINRALRQTPGRVMKRAAKELVKAAKEPGTYRLFSSLPCKKGLILGEILSKSEHYNPPPDLFEIARKVIIPKANHAVMLDNPEAFNKALLEAYS